MSKTIAEMHPDAMTRLRAAGYTGIAEMAQHFYRNALMEEALGFSRGAGAVSNWTTGKNVPSGTAEMRARDWLARRNDAPAPIQITPPADDVMLIVIADATRAAKAKRLLAALGCEVEEA